jgi:hypothetical protein
MQAIYPIKAKIPKLELLVKKAIRGRAATKQGPKLSYQREVITAKVITGASYAANDITHFRILPGSVPDL